MTTLVKIDQESPWTKLRRQCADLENTLTELADAGEGEVAAYVVAGKGVALLNVAAVDLTIKRRRLDSEGRLIPIYPDWKFWPVQLDLEPAHVDPQVRRFG